MNRRGFFAAIAGAIAGAAAAPALAQAEAKIGATLYVRKPARFVVSSGNRLLSTQVITREALKVLAANLQFARTVNRDYDQYFNASPARSLRARGLQLVLNAA
jgi:hypothetical protein